MTSSPNKEESEVVGGAAAEAALGDEPVSPTGQYFNSSVLSVCIIAAFESEVPIDDSPTMDVLKNLFLPISPRFSSIMVRDKHGIQHWKRVPVKLVEHVKVPVFPSGLSVEAYDEYTQDYLTRIAMERLPQHRPLWEIHIIKYPTRTAEGTLVFKLHHALGDGFSLMGALFSCLQRADDPSLPLTFPTTTRGDPDGDYMGTSWWQRASRAICVGLNTAREFCWSLLKSNLVEDDRSPVRSGDPGVEFRPIAISFVTFALDDIRRIKAKLGGVSLFRHTYDWAERSNWRGHALINLEDCWVELIKFKPTLAILPSERRVHQYRSFPGWAQRFHLASSTGLMKSVNDVITGIIFYGIELYIQSQSKYGRISNLTALVLLNTRVISNYQTLKEMSRPNASSAWGNQFGFLHVSLPNRDDAENANPLDFVFEARETIKKKRSSLAVYLTGRLLETLRSLKGPEVTAKYIHATLRNTSMTISNLIGPLEQMHIAAHPIRSLYFMVVGVPQSLTITMVSYMGKLKLAFGAEKDFIDRQLLISCMEKSFTRIFQEALGKQV